MANSAAAAAVEIGAVAIAMNYGLAPAEGVIFTVALCVASVSGGLWVSARNRAPSLRTVPVLLLLIGAGAGLIAGNFSIALTVVGAITIGSFLAPLGTCYSLRLDALASTNRKAEVFALSRTANSVAIILISATLTLSSLQATLLESTVLVLMAAIAVRIASLRVFAARL
jgi:hypothetical protein